MFKIMKTRNCYFNFCDLYDGLQKVNIDQTFHRTPRQTCTIQVKSSEKNKTDIVQNYVFRTLLILLAISNTEC